MSLPEKIKQITSWWFGIVLTLSLLLAEPVQGQSTPSQPELQPTIAPSIGKAELLTSGSSEDDQPSLCVDRKGNIWVAWIAYEEGKGDKVKIRSLKDEPVTPPIDFTPEFGDYFKPALISDNKNRIWAFWAANQNGNVDLYCRLREGTGWKKPLRLTSDQRQDFNQRVCVNRKGQIWITWQSLGNQNSDIYLAGVNEEGLRSPVRVSTSPAGNRDPVIASDAAGRLWIAWCAHSDRDYEIYLRSFSQGKFSPEVNISRDPLFYDLHPSLAVGEDNSAWIAWDKIYIGNHGSSGATEPKLPGEERSIPPKVMRKISLARYDGRQLSEPNLKRPGSGITPLEFELAHGGYPQILIDAANRPWIFYRAWHYVRRPENYYWSVVGQVYSGDRWCGPFSIPHSSGPLEKISAGLAPEGNIWLAWTSDSRKKYKRWVVHREKEQIEKRLPGDLSTMALDNSNIYTIKLGLASGLKDKVNPVTIPLPLTKQSARKGPPPFDLSNPYVTGQKHYRIEVGGKSLNLYWGNLHGHSNVSRCSVGGEPNVDDCFNYSRDILLNNFWVLTDHGEHLTLYQWWKLGKTADLYNRPGGFITLFGYEWTGLAGHQNVIYPERDQPLCSAIHKSSRSPEDLWAALQNHRALTIPHHPADQSMSTDWSHHNEKFQRLGEIFQSCRGSYEYDGCPRQPSSLSYHATQKGAFMHDALDHGYKLGFVCGSDHGFQAAYTAVFSPELSRQAIFEALYNRRCYGSTEKGIFLDFRADGHLMGEEYETSEPPHLRGHVIGTTELSRVDVFKNGTIIYSYPYPKGSPSRADLRLEWNEFPESREIKLAFNQGDIIQIIPAKFSGKLEKKGERELIWASGNPGSWSSAIDLIVEAPEDARITISFPDRKETFSLGEILKKEIIVDLNPGKFMLKKGDIPTQSLGLTEASFEFKDEKSAPGTSWYYLRAIQTNGEMAWSSPIWITNRIAAVQDKLKTLGYTH